MYFRYVDYFLLLVCCSFEINGQLDVSRYNNVYVGCYTRTTLSSMAAYSATTPAPIGGVRQEDGADLCRKSCTIYTFWGLSFNGNLLTCHCGDNLPVNQRQSVTVCDRNTFMHVYLTCTEGRYGTNCGKPCTCAGTNVCDRTAGTCYNTYCPAGYTGRQCNIAGSCSFNNGGCSQICTPKIGGGNTCSCWSGYAVGNPVTQCVDINECAQSNKGGCHQACTNVHGSYTCSCNLGYTLTADQRTCTSTTGACHTSNGGCQHRCSPSGTGVVCSCNDGYLLATDKRKCADINECSVDKGGCQHKCTNTIGSFSCSCTTGYKLATNKRNCVLDSEALRSNAMPTQMPFVTVMVLGIGLFIHTVIWSKA